VNLIRQTKFESDTALNSDLSSVSIKVTAGWPSSLRYTNSKLGTRNSKLVLFVGRAARKRCRVGAKERRVDFLCTIEVAFIDENRRAW